MAINHTHDSIEEIVQFWVVKLGLQMWDIRVVWGDELTEWFEGHDDHCAIWRSRDYDQAKLYVNPREYVEWEVRQAHLLICHELLHLVTKEVEYVLDQIDGLVAPDVFKLVSKAHIHHTEGTVDRLAYRFVEMAGIK